MLNAKTTISEGNSEPPAVIQQQFVKPTAAPVAAEIKKPIVFSTAATSPKCTACAKTVYKQEETIGKNYFYVKMTLLINSFFCSCRANMAQFLFYMRGYSNSIIRLQKNLKT